MSAKHLPLLHRFNAQKNVSWGNLRSGVLINFFDAAPGSDPRRYRNIVVRLIRFYAQQLVIRLDDINLVLFKYPEADFSRRHAGINLWHNYIYYLFLFIWHDTGSPLLLALVSGGIPSSARMSFDDNHPMRETSFPQKCLRIELRRLWQTLSPPPLSESLFFQGRAVCRSFIFNAEMSESRAIECLSFTLKRTDVLTDVRVKREALMRYDRLYDPQLFTSLDMLDSNRPDLEPFHQVYTISSRVLQFLLKEQVAAKVAVILREACS
jgi:hypothetical protein